ncbi:MAG: Rid family detoxifying hydrolase, partial [Wenzhouxiangellaceae bacterium]|nr:Rid family detoxifying hydrolase [Wenzhouxiangellaceae bacterium]
DTLYLSGQIPLDPASGEVIDGGFEARTRRVFDNLEAVCRAAGGTLSDIVKLNVFLTDLGRFAEVNAIMAEYFSEPYPARAAVQVAALPKGVDVEMDAVAVIAR